MWFSAPRSSRLRAADSGPATDSLARAHAQHHHTPLITGEGHSVLVSMEQHELEKIHRQAAIVAANSQRQPEHGT
jgi:pterin-4a-carbinolamine dehydratase